MPRPDTKQFAQLIRENLNISLFECKHYGDGKLNAQLNLNDKTHFVDNSTLRYFKSRIISAAHTDNGLLFYVIESTSQNPDNTKRGFRGCIFDLFGSTVYRPDLDNLQSTSDKAKKAMYAFLNDFDTVAYYKNVFASMAVKSQKVSADYRKLSQSGE